LTTIGNDYSYDRIFSYPLSKWLKDGDLLILFSGSGKSPNIINAAELSKSRGIKTIGITGNNPSGILKDKVHIAVCVPTPNMQRIEDMHLILGHMLCYDISHILNPVGV
jgi:D-sedoheptulose 7-phosphate isomerase